MLDHLYARAARWQRRAYDRRPERRRRLARPVISVGNLSVGGTGKTPVVAAIARRLVQRGERPAILSRGYLRRDEAPGVVVVSDGHNIRAALDRSGDEPLMLARAVPGAIVCVCPDRHLAGVLAERTLGATVHVLDDGFQHHALARDLDLLVTTKGEIPRGRLLPFGRLREPREAAAKADVLIVFDAAAREAEAEARALGISMACGASRGLDAPRLVGTVTENRELPRDAGVVVACGIANPGRFIRDVQAAGWRMVRAVTFPDHHRFSARDVARLATAVSASGASAVLTTDKDAVRVGDLGPLPFPLYRVPLTVTLDPSERLFELIDARIRAVPAGERA